MSVKYCTDHDIQYKDSRYRECPLCFQCDYLSHLLDDLHKRSPASVRVCALLDKQSRRKVAVSVDYFGFSVDDVFVVGCGLDYDEKYRALPGIYALPPE